MKALALVAQRKVEVIELDLPEIKDDEVLVKILGVGVCGSDLSVFEGHREVPSYPWIMGHEGVGEIVEVGSKVSERKVGDKVAIEPNYCCFACGPCLSGDTSGCLNRIIVGMEVPGVMAEFVAVPAEFAWQVPQGLTLDEMVCLEPLTVGVAALRRSSTESHHRCLVIGAGSTGMMLITQLRMKGMQTSFIEPHPRRCDLARQFGAVDFADDAGDTFDRIFETSGTAFGLEKAVSLASPGATITLIGLGEDPSKVTPKDIVRKRLTIIGSMIYDHPQDFSATLSLDVAGLDQIIQGRYHFEEAQAAFESAREVPGKSWLSFLPKGE